MPAYRHSHRETHKQADRQTQGAEKGNERQLKRESFIQTYTTANIVFHIVTDSNMCRYTVTRTFLLLPHTKITGIDWKQMKNESIYSVLHQLSVHVHTHTQTHTHTHTHRRARAHTHTHTHARTPRNRPLPCPRDWCFRRNQFPVGRVGKGGDSTPINPPLQHTDFDVVVTKECRKRSARCVCCHSHDLSFRTEPTREGGDCSGSREARTSRSSPINVFKVNFSFGA